jgi:hypothetical protein
MLSYEGPKLLVLSCDASLRGAVTESIFTFRPMGRVGLGISNFLQFYEQTRTSR